MRLSLPVKFALLALVVAGIGVLGISYYSFRDAGSLLREQSIQQLANDLKRASSRFKEGLERIRSDLTMLSRSDPVLGYIRAVEGEGYDDLRNMTIDLWKQRLVIDFAGLLRQRPEYDQIRYIGLADNGRELVRVERQEERIVVVAEKDLQQKGGREYVFQTALLDAGQQYISNVELNRERGSIVYPLQPVLRRAVPVFTKSGEVFGVLVINANFDKLAKVFETPPKNVEYLIADSNGDFVFHPDKEKRFTGALGGSPYFKKEFPNIDWEEIGHREGKYAIFDLPVRTASLIVQHLHFDPNEDNRHLVLSALASHAVTEEKSAGFGKRLLIGVLAVVGILSLLMALLARTLMAPIKMLTTAADKIASGDDNIQLPAINRHDELGVLANSFKTMLGRLASSRNNLRSLAQSLEEKVENRTEELSRALELAESSTRTKSEFLATMSHEIRTPMSGVIGFADMLLEDDLAEESKEKVFRIKDSTRALLEIINEILDISKMEAGKMEIENIDFHLPSLIDEVLDMFTEKRKGKRRKNLEISASIADDLPEGILSDPTRLRQILINLIGNAVKFTEKGSVVLEVGLVRKTDKEMLRFAVKDTGIGLEQETISKLFSDFTQADASTSRKYQGTGLGLAICKRLVELMGGEIGVESRIGEGSTFWFTLPYREATTKVSRRSKATTINYMGQRKLIIDLLQK